MNLFALVNGSPWFFGPITFSGSITFAGSALLADGSAAAPALAFAADTDTGIFRVGTNEIGFATGGTERASFISQGLKLSNVAGSFTVPNVFANGDQDTGLATIGGNQLALVVGGATALSFNNSVDATFGGNLTTGSNSTISASSGYLLIQPTTTLYLRATSGSVAIGDAGSGAVSLGQPASTTTVQGNLTVSGGTVDVGTGKIKFTNASQILTGFTAPYVWKVYDNSAGRDILNFSQTANTLLTGCTFLVGSGATPSGNGAIQLATHTTSAGGIGFGTDIALYRAGGNTLKLELGVSAGVLWFDNGGNGTGGARILGSSGALTITSNGANSLYLQTGGTAALTLDSSQRCILAGALRLNNAYTVGTPIATGYVTLQDSTGTTYKVLVGT